MKKAFKAFILLLIMLLCASILLTGCNGKAAINGKYYKEKSDGSLEENSWIELYKKIWTNSEEETGSFKMSGNKISFLKDGEELFDGILKDGVLTIEFLDGVYRQKPAKKTNNDDIDDTQYETEAAKIYSVTGGKMSGFSISVEVSKDTAQMDLFERVTVSPGASWKLSVDSKSQNLIPNKYVANLQNGDNIYYILVISADNTITRTYTLNIYRNHYVTITYKDQDVIYTTNQALTHTKLGDGPSISREGYTFNGWGSNGHYVTESKTFHASWTGKEYEASFDGNEGTLSSTKETLTFGSNYTLPVPTRSGYSFSGWWTSKIGGVKLTNAQGESETVWNTLSNITVYAQWSVSSYNLNTTKNIAYAGEVSGAGSKEFNSNVTITATTYDGYTWLGWFEKEEDEEETKVSMGSELTYTFTMSASDKSYEARWMTCPITLRKNLPDAGGVSGIYGATALGAETTITANTNPGYTWLGWYDEEETKVSTGSSLNYTFTMPEENKTYIATWIPCPITLEKNLPNAGEISGVYGATALGGQTTITATTNRGYTWLGWFDEEERKVSTGSSLSYTFTMSTAEKTYEARWKTNLAIITFNNNGGTGSMDPVELPSGDALPPNEFTKEGYSFVGWAESAFGEIIYEDIDVFFAETDDSTISLYARWMHFLERVDLLGTPTENGEYLRFGEYPQTIKSSDVNVGTTADTRGYYLGSDGFYYAKITATPNDNIYTFSTEAEIVDGMEYYFKVEPIMWRILSESNGNALILCESIIANSQYYVSSSSRTINGETVYANNYEHSDVRAWLNNEFYNTAFNELQRALIQTIEVDNSSNSTGPIENQYASTNTNDKIFLPSYMDMINTTYGFKPNYADEDIMRIRRTSDYSRATGAKMSTSTKYFGNGYWWLRSPYFDKSCESRYIFINGRDGSDSICITCNGIVPALEIKLP